ncbi:MAG TPA: FAD-dependent oxidoreductase [Lentisphaeria bacterium]|nr:MAG: tat (twin-arginine translocation) pathway signal sequence [Lentisphaerae bacterium GWF2_49_21]HBC85600.1 FAD-dependent oxidoreductase [Lentisphaeria bacterium]
MKKHQLKAKEIPLNDSYDVIVVGGGPSGCTAAAAAAREGAKTLLIEATSSLGGMGTTGLVPLWAPFSDKKRIIYCGMAQQVCERSKAGMAHVKKDDLVWLPIDPELLKRIYDDLVIGSGAEILFNALMGSVEVENGDVTAIIVASKSGLTAYKAEVFIDASGDADLAAWAGAKFQKGDGKSGELMPATHCFTLANVDEYSYKTSVLDWWDSTPGSWRHSMVRKYPGLTDGHMCNAHVGPGVIGFNAGHIWDVDNTCPESVSKALVEGRKIACEFRKALAEFHPAFKNSFLVNTGSLLGIRETRRIIGDYVLTIDDYMARRSFKDEISRNSYPIDIHAAKNEIGKAKTGKLNVMERYEQFKAGESHGIPYRCLTPKGIRNVLVSGRSVSCDRLVQGSIRVMPNCLCMGEAAGIAGAMALRKQNDVHAINTDALRSRLKKNGAYLP